MENGNPCEQATSVQNAQTSNAQGCSLLRSMCMAVWYNKLAATVKAVSQGSISPLTTVRLLRDEYIN